MASLPNDNEPEPSDEYDEEMIDAGFDPLVFWDQYRQIILVVGGVVLLGLAGYGIYEYEQTKTIAAAGSALSDAVNDDDYRSIISKYPGTIAGGDAVLVLSSRLRDEKKYDDAVQVLQDLIDKNPTHPLVSGADLAIAQTLEQKGDKDGAIARYQEVAAKYPDSYSAPIAVIAQANLLKSEGKIEDARRLFENFQSQFPDSIFSQQAQGELHLLRSAPGAAGAGTAASPTGIPASLLNPAAAGASPAAAAAPTVAASATPEAVTAPVAPVAAPSVSGTK